jgi:hypothetical protein
MNDSPALPTLFGRFTALQREHAHLDGVTQRLVSLCEALLEAPARSLPPELDPESLIASWSVELSRHFGAEEGMSYFGALALERPDLALGIGDLRADHTAMLEAIEELSLLASDQTRREELVKKTTGLLNRFRAHERAENALLREFFGALSRQEL